MSKRVNFSLANNTSGNLGVGTTSPNFKLHVVGDIFATGDITSSSDLRLKTNIETINLTEDKISKIQSLRAVTFQKREICDDPTQKTHIGFIAQEVEKIVPEIVYTDPDTGYKSIAYGNMTAILLEYIKNLNKEINTLKINVNELTNQINDLQKNN